MRRPACLMLAMIAALAAACSTDSAPAPAASSTPLQSAQESSVQGMPQTSPASVDICEMPYLAQFSLREKLAQLLTVGVTGTADAVDVVRDQGVGGIFIGSWTEQSLLAGGEIDRVKQAAKVAPMVTIDEEGGRVSRIGGLIGTRPSAKQIAATMGPNEAYQQELTRARAMARLGITVDFAPVVDVTSQPDDSVIGDRSFSDDPAKVTQYADAYVRGLREGGVGAVMKHFPGHGSASGDSHTGAVTTPPLPQLVESDLAPYRALINSGAAVMVGHLDVPGLTTPNVPASISPQVMAFLRSGVGYGAAPYNGPIFTDDLSGMAAITNRMSVPEAVEAALVAGADVALWISTDAVPQVLDRLENAVATGRLSQQRVDESVSRVARFKGTLNCG